jgi:hypothetical protein
MGEKDETDGNDAHAGLKHFIVPLLIVWALPVAAKESGPARSAPPEASALASLPDARALAARIANRYGAQKFHAVESIHYTFHVRFGGKDIEREWTWYPKQDSVLYRGPDAKGVELQAAYSRKNPYSMASEAVTAIDKTFINDQYWLLFPMHLNWDEGLTFKVSASEKPGEAWHLMVLYPSRGGYTPGDAYDLFLDSSATIKRWIFRKGNSAEPTSEVTWEAPVEIGGLGFSREHRGIGKDFRLWFTDVRVETGN